MIHKHTSGFFMTICLIFLLVFREILCLTVVFVNQFCTYIPDSMITEIKGPYI